MNKARHRFPQWHLLADEQQEPAADSVHEEQQSKGNPKGRGKLDSQAVILLLVNGLFALGNALSGTFVNVYLWKAKSDFTFIAWFALSTQASMALTFWLAGKWVKEHNKMISLRLGVAISALFYMAVLWLQQNAVDYVLLLGVLIGVASGLFWLAFNIVYFEVTDPHNRDRFNGWGGLIGSTTGIIAPWLSGFLIARMTGNTGYRVIFTISLVIFVIGVIVSFFLKRRQSEGRYEWFQAIAKLKDKENPWRAVVAALVAQGLREGVFGFMIGLLVYIATKKEMQLGNFSLITSAVAFVSFWMAGKWLKPRYRKPSMLIGTIMITVVIVPLFWQVSFMTLLIFGIGSALFMPLFGIPMTSSVFDLIGRNPESAERREEYIVLRELGLSVGRMASTLIFIAVISYSKELIVINSLLLGIGAAPIAAWFFMRKLLTELPGEGRQVMRHEQRKERS